MISVGKAILGTVFLSIVISSNADLITSNLSGPTGGGNNVSGSSGWIGQKFVNGPALAALESVDAKLSMGGNVSLWIFSDSAGAPGSVLGSFDINPPLNNALIGNHFPYTGSTLNLAPSTAYWIVAGAPSGAGSYFWYFTGTPSTGPGSIPSSSGYTNTQNGPWTLQAGTYALQVNSVPEPASAALIGLGAPLLRRWRPRSA